MFLNVEIELQKAGSFMKSHLLDNEKAGLVKIEEGGAKFEFADKHKNVPLMLAMLTEWWLWR